MSKLHIVFDGPPGPVSGRFVEVDDAEGHGQSIGEWEQHGDFCHLVIDDPRPALARVKELEADASLPKRRYDVTIHVGGDEWKDLIYELNRVCGEIEQHGPECGSAGGGCTSGHSVNVTHDPNMTNEKYFAAIEAWKVGRSK